MLLGIKDTIKFSIIIPHLTSTVHRLLCDCLLWKEPIQTSYPFLGLLRRRSPRLHTPLPNALSEKQKNPSSKWPGGHKFNVESKHIYCSFISIHYKLIFPDAKPQCASKSSSLDVSKGPHTHSPQPFETSLVSLPPLQIVPRRGPHRHWHQ